METSLLKTLKNSALYHLLVVTIIISLFIIIGNWLPLGGPTATIASMLIVLGLLFFLSKIEKDQFYKRIFIRSHTWKKVWFGAIWKSVAIFIVSLVLFLPLISWLVGSIPDYSYFDNLKGNIGYLFIQLIVIWTIIAFGEEIIFRGFLMTRLKKVFGNSQTGQILNICIAAVIFGYLHDYQGLPGQLLTGLVGALFAVNYIKKDYKLWQNVLMHGLVDTIALMIFFFGWQELIK